MVGSRRSAVYLDANAIGLPLRWQSRDKVKIPGVNAVPKDSGWTIDRRVLATDRAQACQARSVIATRAAVCP
jgi:hypothetical protein